jgi:hypothetical protein
VGIVPSKSKWHGPAILRAWHWHSQDKRTAWIYLPKISHCELKTVCKFWMIFLYSKSSHWRKEVLNRISASYDSNNSHFSQKFWYTQLCFPSRSTRCWSVDYWASSRTHQHFVWVLVCRGHKISAKFFRGEKSTDTRVADGASAASQWKTARLSLIVIVRLRHRSFERDRNFYFIIYLKVFIPFESANPKAKFWHHRNLFQTQV